jgi:hypothetical protein
MNRFNKILKSFLSKVKEGDIAISTKKFAKEIHTIDTEVTERYKLENIAKQFSDKISSELKLAENKIRGIVTKEKEESVIDKEMGLFL